MKLYSISQNTAQSQNGIIGFRQYFTHDIDHIANLFAEWYTLSLTVMRSSLNSLSLNISYYNQMNSIPYTLCINTWHVDFA